MEGAFGNPGNTKCLLLVRKCLEAGDGAPVRMGGGSAEPVATSLGRRAHSPCSTGWGTWKDLASVVRINAALVQPRQS